MPIPSLALQTGTVVFHRSGQFLVGRLSGTIPSTAVALPDLVLLSAFASPATPTQGIQRMASGESARLLPSRPPDQMLLQRIDAFRQRGVLGSEEGRLNSTEQLELLGSPHLSGAEPATPDQILRLPRNFLLRAHPRGYAVDSAVDGRTYLLDVGTALVLAGFANGTTPRDIAPRLPHSPTLDTVAAMAGWFRGRGLLEAPDAGGSWVRAKAEEELPRRKATAKTWREIKPDGRIPVFFMPHMENHYPLALGMLHSAISAWKGGALLDRFQLVPITYLPPDQFLQGPYRKFGPGVWLFSNYMWSDELNLKVSEFVKRDSPRNYTVHGGPSTPSYEEACDEFMCKYSSVDVAVHGEGELAIGELLEQLDRDDDGRISPAAGMSDVAGLTYRLGAGAKAELLRTAPRARMREPDAIPSPYAEGIFDAYEGRIEAAIVETNRGCPFQCTFCDWGSATAQKVSRFEMDRVRGEIEWVGRNEVPVIWVADANFGMLKRDLEIAECIVETKRKYGFPQEVVVNYTKNANERLAEIIRVFSEGGIIGQGIISIQTSDEATLDVIKRKNIKTEKYDELIRIFAAQGLPLSTDLMIGLPGITPEAFDNDLQRYIDVDVAVKAYPTQLLPNSPMAHPAYMKTYRIETDENGFLTSCFSYSETELRQMKQIYELYVATDGYGALRYVLRFLHWEYGVPAMRVLHDLLDQVVQDPDRYPAMAWVAKFFNSEKRMPGGWRRFFEEVSDFVARRYGVERDSAFNSVLTVNEAVMPDGSRRYPMTVELEHDLVEWFTARNRLEPTDARALHSYPPGRITVSDPNGLATIDLEYQQYDTHQYFWELHSPVARPTSVARNDKEEIAA